MFKRSVAKTATLTVNFHPISGFGQPAIERDTETCLSRRREPFWLAYCPCAQQGMKKPVKDAAMSVLLVIELLFDEEPTPSQS